MNRSSAGLVVGRSGRHAISVGLALVLATSLGCSGGEPRPLDTLVQRDGVYLDPEDFRPYTGSVVSVFREDPEAVELSARLVDGRFEGAYERFYRDGSVFGRGEYRAGVWHGPFESFYQDGSVWMRGRYVDGDLDGPYRAFAEDGAVQESGVYAAGEPCGVWMVDGTEEDHPPCPDGAAPDR